MFYDFLLTRTPNVVEELARTFAIECLGDQLKAIDAIQAEPADVIHGRDIASDSLTDRIANLMATILLVEELTERTRHMILLRLKAISLCRVNDAVGFSQAELIGETSEEEV